jgi:hypothetical protein
MGTISNPTTGSTADLMRLTATSADNEAESELSTQLASGGTLGRFMGNIPKSEEGHLLAPYRASSGVVVQVSKYRKQYS